jgi:hypothetical protein
MCSIQPMAKFSWYFYYRNVLSESLLHSRLCSKFKYKLFFFCNGNDKDV